ncbi:MAG: hypothetical protein H6925_07215 [Holosporaceae bacterium]|nr:MAG: hypothetical protein H6925_07215 [Holosporaceae bacterium]
MDVFKAVNASKAKAVVLSLDDFEFASRLTISLRKNIQTLKYFYACNNVNKPSNFKKKERTPLFQKCFAPGFQLASAVFELFGISSDQAELIIEKYKKSLLAQKKKN